jgi:hypothetical protein
MAMYPLRRDLVAVVREGREAAERVRGQGEVGPVPVLVEALAAVQGRDAAEQERDVGEGAPVVAHQPAP